MFTIGVGNGVYILIPVWCVNYFVTLLTYILYTFPYVFITLETYLLALQPPSLLKLARIIKHILFLIPFSLADAYKESIYFFWYYSLFRIAVEVLKGECITSTHPFLTLHHYHRVPFSLMEGRMLSEL